MTREIIAFIADIGGVVAFAVLLATAVWTAYRYLKRKRIAIPKSMVLAFVLYGTVVYLVHMNTDASWVSVIVSILIGVITNLIPDAYVDMYERFIEKYQEKFEDEIEESRNVAERAISVAERATDQSKALTEEIEKLSGQSLQDEEDES